MPSKHTDPCAAYATDALLLPDLQRRVRQALECFYERNYRKILSSLSWRRGQQEDIEDAFQEGMTDFLERSSRVELRAKLDTLLYQIVHNRWIDILRKKRPDQDEPGEEIPDTHPDPMGYLLDAEMQHRLRQAIDQLEPESKKLMDLIIYQHCTPEEVTEIMGFKSVNSVYTQKARCIKYLRKILSDFRS